MLQTIKLPADLKNLKQNLPESKYENNKMKQNVSDIFSSKKIIRENEHFNNSAIRSNNQNIGEKLKMSEIMNLQKQQINRAENYQSPNSKITIDYEKDRIYKTPVS